MPNIALSNTHKQLIQTKLVRTYSKVVIYIWRMFANDSVITEIDSKLSRYI